MSADVPGAPAPGTFAPARGWEHNTNARHREVLHVSNESAHRVAPATIEIREIELPLATLRVGTAGDGPPVIMVPATISLIEDWEPMIRFVAERYSAYFFELPGYGGSTPFGQPFSSRLVAQAVGQLADAIGAGRFGVLGFSFGGLLALRTLQAMPDRVDRLGLLSPYVGKEALLHSDAKIGALRTMLGALRTEVARRGMVAALHTPVGRSFVSWFMQSAGKFETPTDIRGRLAAFSVHSLEVLIAQTTEVLTTSTAELAGPYDVPCLFGMSEFDTMLDFGTTQRFIHGSFADVAEDVWDFPYHAPPEPFTLEDYERDYHALLAWEPATRAG